MVLHSATLGHLQEPVNTELAGRGVNASVGCPAPFFLAFPELFCCASEKT
jgi:hypothetical protein